MAHKALDGSEHTNRMTANKRNASLKAKQSDQAEQAPQDQPADPTQQDASENPDADQHVDALLASGMTPDDIHQHAKKRSGQSQEQMPEQQSSALSSIPGM